MPAAIALTFDNLGEAADLERGLWPADRPVGRHDSVTLALPRLLDELAALGLRATFCVEALNCEIYPDAVREISRRGHEVAGHGWRHERWDGLPPEREAETLARSRRAFAALGLAPEGFRPPGGQLTPRSPEALRAHGFHWCSAAGGAARRDGGLVHVPFDWPLVDAYHRLPSFTGARERAGDRTREASPAETARRLIDGIDALATPRGDEEAGLRAVILHPFLMIDSPGWASARRVLRHLHDIAGSGAAEVAPAGHFVTSVR
jgi:peptidoglycan/xylan/chitin deacetylase (PgdA/CDA1 family)